VEGQGGRNAEVKRNVEASLFVAANKRANPAKQNDVEREEQYRLVLLVELLLDILFVSNISLLLVFVNGNPGCEGFVQSLHPPK